VSQKWVLIEKPKLLKYHWKLCLNKLKLICDYMTQQWIGNNNRVQVMSNCTFITDYSPLLIYFKTAVSTNNRSFISCKDKCLGDHRCVAFSYNSREERWFIPPQESYLFGPLILNNTSLIEHLVSGLFVSILNGFHFNIKKFSS